MISIYKKTILTGLGPMSIESIDDEIKKELEDIIYVIKSFFNFVDYTNIYLDDKIISIQWKGKYNKESTSNLEKNYKDRIDSFVKKIYGQ